MIVYVSPAEMNGGILQFSTSIARETRAFRKCKLFIPNVVDSKLFEDISEDVLPNEATGFKNSKIWSMLYDFQRDAVLAIINKLEKYNGCILADSVGLGKTFTALAVVK